MASVSVIIRVTWDERIYRTIKSLKNQDYEEIIVVQNGTDKWEELEDFCNQNSIKFLYFEKGNASKAYNVGAEVASGDILLLCDSDAYFTKDYIEDVKKYAEYGWIVGGGLIYDDFGEKLLASNKACFLYKSDYNKIGGHDEDFAKPNATDLAFCLRARQKGIKSKVIPQVIYYHPATAHKRGFKVGMAEARANRRYQGYQKTWRMIGWDVLEIWRIIKHIVGLMVGRII